MKRTSPAVRPFLGLLLATALLAAPLRAAEVNVRGAGLTSNFELGRALARLLDTKDRPTLDANAIEDAAVILGSTLGDTGFQHPEIKIVVKLENKEEREFTFDPTFANPLPRPLAATEVTFHLNRGVRSYVDSVQIVGLTVIPTDKARAFFRTEGLLLATKRTNAYAPSRVNRASDAVLSELRQRGYMEATVRTQVVSETEGAVALRMEVREGPRWEMTALRYQLDEAAPPTLPKAEEWVGKTWSPTLEQDLREAIRQAFYVEGYPDVGVHVEADVQKESPEHKEAEIVATIIPGPKVLMGQVRFEGNKITRESVLRRRVSLNPGEPLNPLALERSRYRLARLGIFETTDLRYEPTEGSPRDPIFTLREGERRETNVLLGYSSFDQVRAGVEYRQSNLFGLAHQGRAEIIQSLKSTTGEMSYTVPEIFGESIDGTAKVFGLRREEIAFLREELGTSFTVRRAIRQIDGEATAGYTFQSLRTTRNSLSTQATDDTAVNIAAITLGINGDTRDSPLLPRRGYRWTIATELADPMIGGEATYQRLEFGGAYHTSWGASRWIHVGLTHGLIMTQGANDLTLPVNKRFFPGGDNSIRGFERGEAAPRDADGRFIGAKSFSLLNLELEQALTPNWAAVVFFDALGMTPTLREYPFDDKLFTVGLGVRYQTLVGPLRLEYGHNLNPRTDDPSGTLHFSIGYPF